MKDRAHELLGTVTAKALLDAGPVREPPQPAGHGATDGLRGAHEELLADPERRACTPSPAPGGQLWLCGTGAVTGKIGRAHV